MRAAWLRQLVFPPRCPVCGKVLGFLPRCEECAARLPQLLREPGLPVDKPGHQLEFLEAAYAPFWYEPPIRTTVLNAKYEGRRDALEFLSGAMVDTLQAAGETADLIVPVPSHPRAVRRRGHDTALLFAQALAAHLCLPVCTDLLWKTADTPPQHTLSAERRRVNLLGAFVVKAPQAAAGRRILLADDILTTGATLNECAKMLMAAGAGACIAVCGALARTPSGGRTEDAI